MALKLLTFGLTASDIGQKVQRTPTLPPRHGKITDQLKWSN